MIKYPIQYRNTTEYIPHEMILEHENQCFNNHSQSSIRLAERGGTDYLETYFILTDKPINFRYIREKSDKEMIDIQNKARRWVQAKTYEWLVLHDKLEWK